MSAVVCTSSGQLDRGVVGIRGTKLYKYCSVSATVKNLCLCSTEETVTYILDALGVIFFGELSF